MNNTNKEGNKFNFVTMDENENLIEDVEIREDKPFEKKSLKEVVEENLANNANKPSPYTPPINNVNVKKKIYFSFEARIIIMVALILILFAGACYFALEAMNFGKDQIVSYSENGKATYSVCLNDNNYYGTNCLKENMQYVSSLTQIINTSFEYNINYSQDIEYDIAYHVVGITKIYDKNEPNKILYKSEDVLVERTNLRDISDSINIVTNTSIDYKKYDSSVLNYKNKYGVNTEATLDVVLYLDEEKDSRDVATISIPLTENTFNVTKNVNSSDNKTLKVDNNTWNEYNSVCAIASSILIIISLILLYKTTYLVLKVTTKRNKYQAKLSQILREYDRIIVIARDGYESNVEKSIIKVDNFDELLDARDALGKPIIYSRVNDIKSEFIVEDDDKLFKYTLKDSDL